MTREEEMLQAAADTFEVCGGEFDKAVKMLWITAFITGVDYADSHPKNVWHDTSEIPDKQGNLLYILPQGGLHISNIPSALRTCKLDKVRWEEYVKELGVVQWAYVSDLLHKNR